MSVTKFELRVNFDNPTLLQHFANTPRPLKKLPLSLKNHPPYQQTLPGELRLREPLAAASQAPPEHRGLKLPAAPRALEERPQALGHRGGRRRGGARAAALPRGAAGRGVQLARPGGLAAGQAARGPAAPGELVRRERQHIQRLRDRQYGQQRGAGRVELRGLASGHRGRDRQR